LPQKLAAAQNQAAAHPSMVMSDGMVRLFSNKSGMLSFLRNTGLEIANQIPP
jgi:hypothetical protein